MDFHFQAKRAGGGQVSSRISARDYAEARAMLESRGFRDIELTKVDAISGEDWGSSPDSGFPILRVAFVLIFFVLVVGGIAASIDMSAREDGNDQGEDDLASVQPQPERTRTPTSSIQSIPPPQRQAFDSDRVRRAIYEDIRGRTLRTEPHPTHAGEQLQVWMDITNVSIRRSDEVGYEYDVIITYEIQSGRVRNGNLLNVYSPFPCEVTLHVSENYRVSDFFKMRGNHDRIRDHARLFMDSIEQLR